MHSIGAVNMYVFNNDPNVKDDDDDNDDEVAARRSGGSST